MTIRRKRILIIAALLIIAAIAIVLCVNYFTGEATDTFEGTLVQACDREWFT
ncbi:MAG TPA: hypothetical protein VJZ06_08325 [Mobilitalea sp.]|nr:hypothetical protein [Mobilitalea sp.]